MRAGDLNGSLFVCCLVSIWCVSGDSHAVCVMFMLMVICGCLCVGLRVLRRPLMSEVIFWCGHPGWAAVCAYLSS